MYRDREASGAFFVFYFILAVYAFLRSEREKRILMTPVCLLFLYLTLVLLPVHKEPRYSVALIPSIIGMAGIGIYKMLSQTREIINRLLRPKHIESINRT